MPRLRYSLDEARVQAERLAQTFVATQPGMEDLRLMRGVPDPLKRPESKHPTVWQVGFQPPLPRDVAVMDGGDVWVRVDLVENHVCLADDRD